ncbi:MAG: RagB/SusD family nutrient uptake outer membrane protein [Bacteroidota bacterium]
MKNLLYSLLTAVASIAFFSCEDELELTPITDKVASNFYTNEAEIESAIIGVYAQLQDNGLYGLDLIAAGEVSGNDTFEEIAANDGGRFGQLDDFSTFPGNDLVGDIWRESFIAIQRANTVLNRINNIEFEDESVKNARIGEMKFVRALMYFNLVRLYGDVPLITTETVDPSEAFGQGRMPAQEIYTQIEQDLTEAIASLPVAKQPARPAKGAAQALLGNVYLTQSNFNSALDQLEAVVNSGEYSLAANPADIFGVANEGNSEVLYEVQFATGLDGENEGSPAFSQFRPSGTTANAKGHNLPSNDLLSLYEANDTRREVYIGIHPANVFSFSLKFEETVNPNDGGSDFIVIRYSDVVLKYAEALNETGQTTEAINQLNLIRNRAGLTNATASSAEAVRDAIRLERRLELINEGH